MSSGQVRLGLGLVEWHEQYHKTVAQTIHSVLDWSDEDQVGVVWSGRINRYGWLVMYFSNQYRRWSMNLTLTLLLNIMNWEYIVWAWKFWYAKDERICNHQLSRHLFPPMFWPVHSAKGSEKFWGYHEKSRLVKSITCSMVDVLFTKCANLQTSWILWKCCR